MSRSPAFWSKDRRPLPGVLLLGATESMIGPYLVLYGAQRMRLSAVEIGLFLSLTATTPTR
ncbi:hypothetical protein ACIBQX_12520 [Nonomuraea sp. NPDC049714]|uniref:hypothetical protein n=1 Tax=Nonomuraea sp. NPDC049714 TaxID=3364357 RepID=UPI00378AE6A3